MNLSTARSERRAREVGIRKSVGSNRSELIFQFLGESLLITLVAFVFGLLIVELSMPFFNDIVSKKLSVPYSNPVFWSLGFGLVLITGLISGSYPAFTCHRSTR
ncbi:MAG: FtsX-like permease family protein [Flammeovirgaceae bacterium]|nr:FtsX-like permease family protein [Flammeovirgaceae bacterium]